MKRDKTRHYLPVLAKTKARCKKRVSENYDGGYGQIHGCTEELVKRLNQLGNTPPFSLWQRHRENDPL